MAVLTSALVFSFVWVVCSASNGIQLMRTEIGDDVLLECRGNSSNISLVTWTRPDLGKHQFVFFCSENTPVKSNQLPAYHDRVSLLDPKMKNGNVSVVLENVTNSDNGTYECLVREKNTKWRKPQSRNKIQLTVTDGALEAEDVHEQNSTVVIVWVVVAAIVMVAVVAGMVVAVRYICPGVCKRVLKRVKRSAAGGADEKVKLSDP